MGGVWNEANDDEFGKVMTGKQTIRRGATIDHSIFQSQKRSVVANSKEEGDNDSLPESTVDSDHPLPNQPMLPPVPSEILSPLTDISGADTPLPKGTLQNFEEDLPESPDTLQGDSTTDQPESSRQSRTKSGVLKRVDYQNLKKPGKAMLVSQSMFHAKRIPQSHTHMVRVLSALANRDNLGLSHHFEPQNYQEARNSPHWLSWKAAMDLEFQSLLDNETWVLVLQPENRFVIDNQGAIALVETSEFHKRTKHIDTKFHWVREVIERGTLLLEFLPTRFMAADGLTKPLPPKQFQRFLAMMGMA